MEDLNNDRLFVELAAGNAQAFAGLYDRLGFRLFQVAMSMLGRREDAEDAVQETFIALVRSRSRFAAVLDIEAYIFTALRRSAVKCATKRKQLPIYSTDAVQSAPSRADSAVTLNEDFAKALQTLPADQREVIALKIDGELTFQQIGAVLGISGNTAASRYRYALEKLRSIFHADEC